MPIKIQAVTNAFFNANTYIIKSSSNDNACYLIDIGNYDGVMSELENNEYIKIIFLTHAHYDHFSGINKIIARFPECFVYCSPYTKIALANSKMNLSFYHHVPTVFTGDKIRIVSQEDKIEIYPESYVEIWDTPGHNQGSLSFKIDQSIFTGDSLIPETTVVTKLKSGNKAEAQRSIIKIKDNTSPNDVIYPGHGRSFEASKIDWNFYH